MVVGSFPSLTRGRILASSSISRAAATATNPDRSLELALAAARVASETRGRDVVVLDMREITPMFDYFVLATGASRRQMAAMSDEIDEHLQKSMGDRRLGTEGYTDGRWILLDYGNVVIHLFDGESRDYYGLEHLWSRAPRVPLPVPAVELGVRSPD